MKNIAQFHITIYVKHYVKIDIFIPSVMWLCFNQDLFHQMVEQSSNYF